MTDIFQSLPRPEPAAGVAAYEAERAARLAFDPRTRENWDRYVAAARGRSDVDYLPVKLDVENVSRCNFACRMCAVSTWRKGIRARDMTYQEFCALINEQYGLVEIKLNGIGEPLMQGGTFYRMINYARARRIWTRITTNASLLHLNENYKYLVLSGVNEIDISIDGADKATFEEIRRQSNFQRVIENCQTLNGFLRSRKKPSAKMWTLVQKANVANLSAHVDLARRLGFRHLVFSTQLHGWGSDALAEANKAQETTLSQDYAQWLVRLGYFNGVRVAFWDVASKFEREAGKRCPWPFERAVVTSDGRTVPCCMIGDPDKFELGTGQKFIEVWRGEEYREFRQAHLDGALPKVCEECYR